MSAHSLSYGGATSRFTVIEYFGGWAENSKALKIYIQVGAGAVDQVSRIMAKGINVSLEESRPRATSNKASADKVGSV